MGNLSALKTRATQSILAASAASLFVCQIGATDMATKRHFGKYEEPTNNKIGCLEDEVNPKTKEIRKCMGP